MFAFSSDTYRLAGTVPVVGFASTFGFPISIVGVCPDDLPAANTWLEKFAEWVYNWFCIALEVVMFWYTFCNGEPRATRLAGGMPLLESEETEATGAGYIGRLPAICMIELTPLPEPTYAAVLFGEVDVKYCCG